MGATLRREHCADVGATGTGVDGRAGHEAIAGRHLDATQAAGAEVIDLTGAPDDEHFHDTAHPNQPGRVVLTDRVAALLA